MAEIHKIQVKINGILTIALIDKREPYSFMTTSFAKVLGLKIKRPSACELVGPIVGKIPHFSLFIENTQMSFSVDAMLIKDVPILMLGKDWLKMVKARHNPSSETLKINNLGEIVCTHIVRYDQEFENSNNEQKELELILNNEFELTPDPILPKMTEVMLINLEDPENIVQTPAISLISKDVLQIDVKSFQQEFDQNNLFLVNKIDEDNDIYDEILQIYLEINEEELEVQEEFEDMMSSYSSLTSSSPNITSESEIYSDSNIFFTINTTTEKEIELFNDEIPCENIVTKILDDTTRWVLQQRQLQKMTNVDIVPVEPDSHFIASTNEIFSGNNSTLSNAEYQWKRRKKLKYKNYIDADFTVPHFSHFDF